MAMRTPARKARGKAHRRPERASHRAARPERASRPAPAAGTKARAAPSNGSPAASWEAQRKFLFG